MMQDKKYYTELSQEIFERIEDYLAGNLSQDEMSAFEHEMQYDELLRNEVELQQKLQAALSINAIGKAYHTKEQRSGQTTTSTKIISLSWIAKVAAAVAILAIPVYFLFFDKVDLYQKYYEPDSGLPTVMGVTDNYEFQDAMVDYKMEDYQKAKGKWMILADDKPQNDTLNYYLAMADLNLKNFENSFQKLDEIPSSSTFYVNALWYQALIAIHQKDYDLAKTKLKQLDTERANELLRELK